MKTFFSIFVSLLLAFTLPITLFSWTLKTTLLEPQFYHDQLVQADAYHLATQAVAEMLDDQLAAHASDLSTQSTLATLEENATPDWFYETFDRNIAAVFSWLQGTSKMDQLELSVETTPLQKTIQQLAGNNAGEYINHLLNIPTQFSLQHDAIGAMDPTQRSILNHQLKLAQDSYHQFVFWLWLLTGLSCACVLILFCLHLPRWRSAVRWASLPVAIISTLSLVGAAMYWLSISSLLQFIIQQFATQDLTAASQQFIQSVLSSIFTAVALRLIIISGGVGVIAFVIAGLSRFAPLDKD